MQEFSELKQPGFADWVERSWGIRTVSTRTDKEIQGSPERSAARVVIEDDTGTLYLLEKFDGSRFSLRNRVAQTVQYLNTKGLKTAVAYLRTIQGDFLPFYEGHCFGVTPFLNSTVLVRPDYLNSGEMGKSLALFLLQLAEASIGIEKEVFLEHFSIKTYIIKLFSEMKRYDIVVYDKFLPFLTFLNESFMKNHDLLPQKFCHGDFHPLNVIWNGEKVKAVIDWEFTGIKPQIYDAANLVGCAGIEDPNSLAGPMVMNFLTRVQASCVYEEESWQIFPEYVLALRFGWLSEWLRKKDMEMIQMEADYMQILMKNMDALKSGWALT